MPAGLIIAVMAVVIVLAERNFVKAVLYMSPFFFFGISILSDGTPMNARPMRALAALALATYAGAFDGGLTWRQYAPHQVAQLWDFSVLTASVLLYSALRVFQASDSFCFMFCLFGAALVSYMCAFIVKRFYNKRTYTLKRDLRMATYYERKDQERAQYWANFRHKALDVGRDLMHLGEFFFAWGASIYYFAIPTLAFVFEFCPRPVPKLFGAFLIAVYLYAAHAFVTRGFLKHMPVLHTAFLLALMCPFLHETYYSTWPFSCFFLALLVVDHYEQMTIETRREAMEARANWNRMRRRLLGTVQ